MKIINKGNIQDRRGRSSKYIQEGKNGNGDIRDKMNLHNLIIDFILFKKNPIITGPQRGWEERLPRKIME